jgi:hypothetical protein
LKPCGWTILDLLPNDPAGQQTTGHQQQRHHRQP